MFRVCQIYFITNRGRVSQWIHEKMFVFYNVIQYMLMEEYFNYIAGVIVVAVILIVFFSRKGNEARQKSRYRYELKGHIMTATEALFLKELQLQDNEYVVPQAHLSMFLNHKMRGQSWKGAFSKINGKSVDFLVVEKETNRPLYAIEVDDFSHTKQNRIERDIFVENVLKDAGIPLKRFSNDERLNYAGVSGNSDATLPREP